MEINFGRIELVDEQDKLYPAAPLLATASVPDITEQYWWDESVFLNQGTSSMCTVYSALHWLHDGPVIQNAVDQVPIYNPVDLYRKFQANDGLPGIGYKGTTIRAGAKVLKELGFIKEYRWAESLDDIVKALLVFGPVVVGSRWWGNMITPDSNGFITTGGKDYGGHAYLLNGVDNRQEFFRLKNSWGRGWGQGGHAFIRFDEFDKLLKDHGEVYIALEVKLDHIPPLNSIPDEDKT